MAAAVLGVSGWLLPVAAVAAGDTPPLAFVPEARALPNKVLLLDAAKAGKRFVAVGERGRILYTDDDGQSWKVAATPVLTTLTSVAFADDKNGVVVGHRGTVLLTQDGGTTWRGTKVDAKEQAALLAVRMDGEHGIAVGAYGAYLETLDAGRTWAERRILGADFDRHLNAVVAGKGGAMLVAGEAGTLAVSQDGGRNWTGAQVAVRGHVFRRPRPGRGTALVFGMRGNVFRPPTTARPGPGSNCDPTRARCRGAELPDGSVVLVGASGHGRQQPR